MELKDYYRALRALSDEALARRLSSARNLCTSRPANHRILRRIYSRLAAEARRRGMPT